MTRLQQCFTQLGNRRALVCFITAGDPTLEHTLPAMHALVAGGANVIELGVPFSDPEAEGPAIQASSQRALANGVSLNCVLQMVAEFRTVNQQTSIVLMGYLNSILAMPDFPERAQQAGVDGLIMVNLPPEEAHELEKSLADHQIDIVYMLAPTTTDKRAELILDHASGFVYYVSLKGITGADHLHPADVAQRLAKLRKQTNLPICVGFGIKDVVTAKAIGQHANGVVVGSVLVNLMYEHRSDPEQAAQALQAMTGQLRQGLDSID